MAEPDTATVAQAALTYDPLASVQTLTDPAAVEFVATQLNEPAQNQNRAQGAVSVKNLDLAIQDIIVDTLAQGAGTLEVHVIDPNWALTSRYGDRPAFIDVDDSGLLIPVDVNFPNGTDMWWRLAQAQPSTIGNSASANLVLIFEDRIATMLRDLGGPRHAGKNQTRAQFIYSCVRQVPGLRFVCPALTQPAGSVAGDTTAGHLSSLPGVLGGDPLAPSAKNPKAPDARKNPAKAPGVGKPGKRNGAVWTPNGWRYTKPVGGHSVKEIDILNPPTNQRDGGPFDGIQQVLSSGF